MTQVGAVRWWKKQYWNKKKILPYLVFFFSLDIIDISITELWFLARTVVDDYWACAGEYYVYGGREKSEGSLEMVENGVEGYFKRQVILWKFWNSWYFTEIFKSIAYGILWRFLNPWYLTKVLKDFSWGLKKLWEIRSPWMV